MSATSPSASGRRAVVLIALVGVFGAYVAHLKGESTYKPPVDPRACEDAIAVGAECSLCEVRFKLCRGHFVYEPITVMFFEAFCTVIAGAALTLRALGYRRGIAVLFNWRLARAVVPIGFIYVLGDMAELAASGISSPMLVAMFSQSRLLMAASMRWIFLGRRQTLAQWTMLLASAFFCILSFRLHSQSFMGKPGPDSTDTAVSHGGQTELSAVVLMLVKNLISCGGAVFSEHFLQHRDVRDLPLSATQFHFKGASLVSAFLISVVQGSGPRIFATTWDATLHPKMPLGVVPNMPRTPFFGGWAWVTWLLVATLILNNFLLGAMLRRLSSVCKYAAGAFTLAITYAVAVVSGVKDFSLIHGLVCLGIMMSVMIYAVLPSPPSTSKEASTTDPKIKGA